MHNSIIIELPCRYKQSSNIVCDYFKKSPRHRHYLCHNRRSIQVLKKLCVIFHTIFHHKFKIIIRNPIKGQPPSKRNERPWATKKKKNTRRKRALSLMNSELAMDSPTPPASPLLSQPLDLLDQQEHIVGMDTIQNSNKLVNSTLQSLKETPTNLVDAKSKRQPSNSDNINIKSHTKRSKASGIIVMDGYDHFLDQRETCEFLICTNFIFFRF